MSQSVVISVDAMGGDHGPSIVVPGIAQALQALPGVRFLLHGDSAAIESELAKCPAAKAVSEVRHCEKSIGMDEKPAQAMRRGKGSSMWNAIEAIREGQAQACVSAGNTGALMAISKLILRMGAELERPAIVANWPTMKGVTTVLDVGANVESDAAQLVEFAIMGAAFHHAVHGAKRPTVGLLNVGSEDQKGHEEVREAHAILRETALDFDYHGFVEGNDIAHGTVDVVVTDGFTGNVALKTAEGLARFFTNEIKSTLTSGPLAMLGALIASGALKKMRHRLDPSRVNGAPLLGLNGIVVKSHGGADANGFASAIRVATNLARSDFRAEIDRNLKRLTANAATAAPAGGQGPGADAQGAIE
ncbi:MULTISPECIES: phosphate acyltransferase PlsX [unclassified Caulobacter]|uniref:phosphate acyltransferase PlsX n=1 Tax=unclassified Caulobacter TaxID=2648921 RepID=UPI0009E6AF79|nr:MULTISPECIES: phosphate acyltransferase PlsX [unclassified Caulobacter]AZS21636.1 phosphate acyltransferase PlsX [Caulobacter sp. FWC26]